jgi:hypothetical protein
MDEDVRKGDNSPLDSIKNLAHKSFTAKMEKAFAPIQELIILKMEANLSELVLTKHQFIELMTNAGFVLNRDRDGDYELTKQIQFIIDKGITVDLTSRDSNGETEFSPNLVSGHDHYLYRSTRDLRFFW